jgi:creatinine amidohydrolase/Fe(II)-dependent formamide hydrolase-like protein
MAVPQTHERLHRLEQLTLAGLRALDRDRTIVMLPVGMIEVHGDHLPLGTDTYAVNALALAAAAWLLEGDASLHVLLLPTIPYGTDPIDRRRPELFRRAGSLWIGRETLKAIVRDITDKLVGYGFRRIFPVGFHGGPDQSRVLDEICAEMRARHAGLVMYEPVGYVMAGAAIDVDPGLATLLGRPLSPEEQVMLKGSIHGSMFETSMMLHLAPKLVDPGYRHLRTVEWGQLYQDDNWPGYVGAGPAHANAEIGAAVIRWRGVRAAALIKAAVGGDDLTQLPRHPTPADEARSIEPHMDIDHAVAASPQTGGNDDPTPSSASLKTGELPLTGSSPDEETRPGGDAG